MKININGINTSFEKNNGYAKLTRTWEEEDKISLSFDFQPRLVRSISKVRYNVQRACVFMGPLLYCLEAVDNGSHLNQILLSQDQKFELVDDDLTEGCICLYGDMLRLKDSKDALYSISKPDLIKFKTKMIPYYLWANRGENEMLVWLNEKI